MNSNSGKPIQVFVPATGLNYEGLFWGKKHNKPILCFHGWQDNSASFIPLGPLLASDYAVWSFDLSGHGKSAHIGVGASYNFLDWGLSILHLADALGIDKITTVSHSMGAALSGLMASMFPERFEKLCLIEALFPMGHDLYYYEKKATKLYQSRMKEWPVKEITSEDEAASLRRAAGDMSQANAKLIAQRNVKIHPRKKNCFTWAIDPRIKIPLGSLTYAQLDYHLERLNTPTLVIMGKNGAEFVKEQIENAKFKAKSNIQHTVLKGGHHVHMDEAEKTATCIKSFLEIT